VKPIPILLGLAFFAGANFFPFHNLVAQSLDVSATVQFSNSDAITVTDFSDPIGVQPGELVNITLQFSSDFVGQAVKIDAPDGGSSSLGSAMSVVGNDGTITFGFSAAGPTGRTQLGLPQARKRFALECSVSNTRCG